MERHIINKAAEACYLPINDLISHLLETDKDFRVSMTVSGTLLELADRYHPHLLESYRHLGKLAQQTKRLEFVAEPYYHSLSSLFKDARKKEFRNQIELHRKQLRDMLGVETHCLVNSGFLFNNGIAATAGEMGFKGILCEPRNDMLDGRSPNSVYINNKRTIKVLPRNRDMSTDILQRFTSRNFSADEYALWLSRIDGEMVFLGLDCETLAHRLGAKSKLTSFFYDLPKAIRKHSGIVVRNPSEIADSVGGARPVADVGDLATSSWTDSGRNTNLWLGNRSQQELFQTYQAMEHKIKSGNSKRTLEVWRNLGSSDNFHAMCTALPEASFVQQRFFSHHGDASEAIMAYTVILTELRAELQQSQTQQKIIHNKRRPRILLITPEVTELPSGFGNMANMVRAKGGGLADISSALVAELIRLGLDIHIALPKYERQMRKYGHMSQGEADQFMTVFQSSDPIHLATDSSFSYVQDVYEGTGQNTSLHRATAFQRQVINNIIAEALPEHGKMLIHCNDWMTGLIPAAAKLHGIPSVFTVHNIHTDGNTLRNLELYGIDVGRFWKNLYLDGYPMPEGELWEKCRVNFLLSGIKAADHVNTVSPTFLQEIVDGFFPDIIDGRIRRELAEKTRSGCASGILNAPKSEVDPKLSPLLIQNYSTSDAVEGKKINKLSLQRKMGLQINAAAPVMFWPHRLFEQKGPRLLAEIALSLVNKYADQHLQIAVVGNGAPEWEDAFGTISCGSNGRIGYKHFDPVLSEIGKAGADFILMPSLYEPCGLPQMEGMRYGTLPIVRATGGLKDSVQHLNIEEDTGNGFVFNDYVPDALWWACNEAMKFYALPAEKREAIIQRVMRQARNTFNLERTTIEYVKIYERLLGEKLL